MILFSTIFFILVAFWIILFVFNSLFNAYFLIIGIVLSFFITRFLLISKLYSNRSEFLFLQFGFYKLLLNKLGRSFSENLYLAFQFLKPDNNLIAIFDYLFVENDNIYQNSATCSILNLNFGCVSTIIKNQCIIVHSMNELFFTPNQLFFLNIESQKMNDDNLI